jgi:alpha,alpha-trehalase
VLFKDLFIAVQTAQIYPDGKAFADAVPNAAPDDILRDYHAEQPNSPAALKHFVEAHFVLPSEIGGAPSPPDQVSILAHIDRLWDPLTRTTSTAPPYSSMVALPHPYVVPGGRFREMYYWDSYFTMLGLATSGRHDLVAGMVRDFAYLIDTFDHVPNGARTYYLSRSQPPFFFAMVGLVSPEDSGGAYAGYLPQFAPRIRLLDGWRAGLEARRLAPARRGDARRIGAQSLLGRSGHAARRVVSRRHRACAREWPCRAPIVSRRSCGGGERLGFRLALVRGRAHARDHGYHGHRARRSQ